MELPAPTGAQTFEICILAGGKSSRMGTPKASLPLGQFTMLETIRQEALNTGCPVRVIDHDLVPPCGPLSGIFTALQSTRFEAVLFLACDMPLVSHHLLRLLQEEWREPQCALFTRESDMGAVGFPFIMSRKTLSVVEAQIDRQELSLTKLAIELGPMARILTVSGSLAAELTNVNTPEEFAALRGRLGLHPR